MLLIREMSDGMRKICALIFIGFIMSMAGSIFAAQSVDDILNAIVRIKATVPDDAYTARILGTEREGNGVIIDDKGHILTIGYLILEASAIQVRPTKGDPINARFVAYDYQTGFGILRAEKSLAITPVRLGKSSRLQQGDPVLVAGFGGPGVVLGSRVVSRGEFVGYWEYLLENAIYTSPPFSDYGGAALIGSNGELLGIGSILTQLNVPGMGVLPCNMSVPIDLIKPILSDLIDAGRSSQPQQPWLGIHAAEAHGRVFIIRVTPGGPAEKAGIKAGDLVVAVDRSAVKGLSDFFRQIWDMGPAGVEVPLQVLRESEIRQFSIQTMDRYKFLKVSRQN